jgi:hypothetical protein
MRSIEQAFDRRPGVPAAAGARRKAAGMERTVTMTAAGSGVRLTRRGRAAVVLLMLLVLVVGGFTLGRASSQAAGPQVSRPLPTVTVAPGETLWQIAARVAPQADRRALVAQIETLNHLSGGHVVAGMQLRLPRVR